ncbi:MAG: hypothetical protein AB201_01170 [Parcubacteria bacterium C7867-006]|nr:MAG: hypothetical protein AB201_01170 [Parcubacteria bacterium C7867-006]
MTTILFFVSLFVLASLVGSKVFEIKVRKIESLSSIFAKGDEQIHKLIDLAIFKYNRYKKIAHIFVFEFIPSYIYELLVKMKDYVSKKYYSSADGFRGRRVLRTNGSVSFFLERLADDKNSPEVRKV